MKPQAAKKGKPRGIRQPKGYAPGKVLQNLHLAHYGNIAVEAKLLFDACRWFCELNPMTVRPGGQKRPLNLGASVLSERIHRLKSQGLLTEPVFRQLTFTKKELQKWTRDTALEIAERLLWATKNKDGYFFRDLAELCEQPAPSGLATRDGQDRSDRLRRFLLAAHWPGRIWAHGDGTPQGASYTASQLCELAIQGGIVQEISVRYMHQVCARLGIQLLKAKRGPKLATEHPKRGAK